MHELSQATSQIKIKQSLMEGISTQVFHNIHSYWRRRSYQRLESSPRRSARPMIRLGGGRSSGRRYRKSKTVMWPTLALRLKVLTSAPLRLLNWMKNTYVDALLMLGGSEAQPAAALSRARSGSGEALLARRVPRARQASTRSFERRMMQHIYMAIVEPEVLPCSAQRA